MTGTTRNVAETSAVVSSARVVRGIRRVAERVTDFEGWTRFKKITKLSGSDAEESAAIGGADGGDLSLLGAPEKDVTGVVRVFGEETEGI